MFLEHLLCVRDRSEFQEQNGEKCRQFSCIQGTNILVVGGTVNKQAVNKDRKRKKENVLNLWAVAGTTLNRVVREDFSKKDPSELRFE